MKDLISIIVPIYNADSLISKCLISLKYQTYKNIEILLIDDGSTDSSSAICEKFCSEDNRFKLFHKKNGGVSSARNYGLSVSKGEYISFVDPDDYVENNMFNALLEELKTTGSDISVCNYYEESISNSLVNKTALAQSEILSPDEALNTIIKDEAFKGFVWNKLISASLIKKQPPISFDTDIYFCEDLLFCCEIIKRSKQLVYTPKPYYHYIIHDKNVSLEQFSYKKITALNALDKIIVMLDTDKKIEVNNFKTYYMHLNISLLMHGIYEKKIDMLTKERLKNNLYQYNLISLNKRKIKYSCLLARISLTLYYKIWKILT